MRRVRSVARLALVFAVLAVTSSAWAQTVAVVTTSPAGDSAATYLESQIDYPVQRRTTEHAAETDALMAEARAHWQEDLVVVIDADNAVIRVLRPRDGTVASRTLDKQTASAPYAISLAAVELLELVNNAPSAKKPATRAPPKTKPPPPPPAQRLAIAPWLGALFVQNGDVGLLQPIVGVELQLKKDRSGLWYSFGLNAAGLTSAERRQAIFFANGSSEPGSVTYRRDQVALRAGVGHRQASGCALGFFDIAAAHISVTARDASDQKLGTSARWAPLLLSLGGELRYALGAGFYAGIGAGLAWLPSAHRYYAAPANSPVRTAVFREGVFEFRAQPISLIWESQP